MNENTMVQYPLETGHQLFTKDHKHGVVRAPFGCRKVLLIDKPETVQIDKWLDGIFSPSKCMPWLEGEEVEAKT